MFLTSNRKSSIFYSIFAISTILILSFYMSAAVSAEKDNLDALRQMGKAFASIAQKASPAVVGVVTETVIIRDDTQSPFGNFFGPQRRGRSQGQQPRRNPNPVPPTRETQGSGFIISPDGYILTNNHMVEGTSKIEIELNSGQNYTAKVTGVDVESDIALIKIDANNLPYLELADSDALEVGEWVLAIGNPLGLAHTVTAGIVSAKGRTGFNLNDLENYIQTDAAINFGNSGGPLLNLDGKVVGINTAIAGSSGNIGLGFAVPINMAKFAYKQALESGTVEHGALGIFGLQTLSSENAAIYGLDKNTKGVTFSSVIKNSASDKAGLTHKDVILELDGKPIESALDLQTQISMLKPDTKVVLTIWRNEKKEKIEVTLGKRSALASLQTTEQLQTTANILGFKVEDVNEQNTSTFGFVGKEGAVVIEVDPASQAKQSGISLGTLIKEVNRQTVRNVKEFAQAIDIARKKGMTSILLWVNIKGADYNVYLKLP